MAVEEGDLSVLPDRRLSHPTSLIAANGDICHLPLGDDCSSAFVRLRLVGSIHYTNENEHGSVLPVRLH